MATLSVLLRSTMSAVAAADCQNSSLFCVSRAGVHGIRLPPPAAGAPPARRAPAADGEIPGSCGGRAGARPGAGGGGDGRLAGRADIGLRLRDRLGLRAAQPYWNCPARDPYRGAARGDDAASVSNTCARNPKQGRRGGRRASAFCPTDAAGPTRAIGEPAKSGLVATPGRRIGAPGDRLYRRRAGRRENRRRRAGRSWRLPTLCSKVVSGLVAVRIDDTRLEYYDPANDGDPTSCGPSWRRPSLKSITG